jgi:hypothetical protein
VSLSRAMRPSVQRAKRPNKQRRSWRADTPLPTSKTETSFQTPAAIWPVGYSWAKWRTIVTRQTGVAVRFGGGRFGDH